MVSGIRFFACSGAMGQLTTGRLTPAAYYAAGGSLPADRGLPNLEIFQLIVSDTESPTRIGFFGAAGAPNSPVVVGQYQDRTHRTNHNGADLGVAINAKYTGDSTVEHSGVPFTAALTNIPGESGTLLLRFQDPNLSNVITQQGVVRAINLNATSGAPDTTESALATNITVQALQLPDTDGYAGDTSWTEISSGGSSLTLEDQSAEMVVHDYHILLSAAAQVAGRKRDFAIYAQLEFL